MTVEPIASDEAIDRRRSDDAPEPKQHHFNLGGIQSINQPVSHFFKNWSKY